MNSGKSQVMYLLVQFGGYFFQAAPLPFLLYAPFSGAQLRMDKKRLLLFLELSLAVLALVCAACMGRAYLGDHYMSACRWIVSAMTAVWWLAGTLVYILSFQSGVRGKLLSYMISMQFALFARTTSEIVTKSVNEQTSMEFVPHEISGLAVYAVFAAVIAPAVYYLLKTYGFQRMRSGNSKTLRLISGGSVLLFVLCGAAMLAELYLTRLTEGRTANILLSILLISVFLMEGLTYVIFFSCLQIEERQERIHVQLAAFEIQAQRTAEKISEEKRRSHNLRHHFRTLASLLENHRYEEIETYLRKYLKEWELAAYRPVTLNPMFDTILSYYINEAEQNGIRVRQKIEIREHYAFEYMDMTVLLGNALENAVEACVRSEAPAPFISIDLFQVKRQLLIQIENTCESGGMLPGREPGSSKRGRISGYGIRSMRMIVEKYHGDMEYWKQGTTFTLRMILHIPGAEGENPKGGGGKWQ